MRGDWESAARMSPREKAVTTKTVEHEGKRISVDIVMPLHGSPCVLYQDVALEVYRYRVTGREVDDPSLRWRPY